MKFLIACVLIMLIGAALSSPSAIPEGDIKKTEKRGIYGGFGYGGYGGFGGYGHGYGGGYGHGFGYPIDHGHFHGPSYFGHGYGGFPHGFGGYGGYHHFH